MANDTTVISWPAIAAAPTDNTIALAQDIEMVAVCAQFDGTAATIENGPMQIILDVMVDNTWQRSWNVGLLDSTLVRDLGVDYIRVFQQR